MSSLHGRQVTLAIVNPAAGGGRCGKRAPAMLERLRRAGVEVEERLTSAPRDATRIAREAYAQGTRSFLAVGGDGTCCEVVNGLANGGFEQDPERRARLGVLPLGTGNSFLREFVDETAAEDGSEHTVRALIEGRRRSCDVLRLTHAEGKVHFVNLFGFGFATDVTINTLRGRYKRWGNLGYVIGVLHSLARLRHKTLALRVEGGELETRPLTLLCVCNSRYTAGAMMMAPSASVSDGLADLIRVEPLGRLAIVRAFPRIYRGTHVRMPTVSARAAPRIEFEVTEPVEVMVDGEILRIVPRSIEVLPGALEICA